MQAIDFTADPRLRPLLEEVCPRPFPWRRTAKGSTTRLYTPARGPTLRLTVYQHPAGSGRYCWCLARPSRPSERPTYSPRAYGSEELARLAVLAQAESRTKGK